MVVDFDLVTKVDVFRTIGDVSIPNDEIFALLEKSLSVKQVRSIINFGIQGFEKFYCCDIIPKIHQNIKWSSPNQVTTDDHEKNENHEKQTIINEQNKAAPGHGVIGIARTLIGNNYSIDYDWADCNMKAVLDIPGLMSKIYNFCDLWSFTQCKCVNRRWMYDVYNMKYISGISINKLIKLGSCDLSSIIKFITSSSTVQYELLSHKDRLSLYEYQRYKRLILQCKYCDTISIDIDCNAGTLSNKNLNKSNDHWFSLIGNNFNQIDKIIFDSNCSLNRQGHNILEFFTKYKNSKITKRIQNRHGDTNKLGKNIYLQMMSIWNCKSNDCFKYINYIFLNFIHLMIKNNKLSLKCIKFEIELYFDAEYQCKLQLLESQLESNQTAIDSKNDDDDSADSYRSNSRNSSGNLNIDDDDLIGSRSELDLLEKTRRTDIIKRRMKSYTIEVINKVLKTKLEEKNLKLESLKTVEICIATPEKNGRLSDISGYQCLNQIITIANAPKFENLKLMISATFPSHFKYVLTQILNNKTGYSDYYDMLQRSQFENNLKDLESELDQATKIKSLEIWVEKNIYRLEPLFSAICGNNHNYNGYGNHYNFCLNDLTRFEIVPFQSFYHALKFNKYRYWELPSIAPIDHMSSYVSTLKDLYSLLTMIDKIRVGVARNWSSRQNNNNDNNNNLDLDNQDYSWRGSTIMRGINVILKIDGARVIHQWQNVDLDLSKSQKLMNVVKILYQWYKCGTMMNVGVGFQVPIGKQMNYFYQAKKNDNDKNTNKNKKNNDDKILNEKKEKAIKESKWVELIIKAIIHVFEFQVETQDVINCLKKILVNCNNDKSDVACFLNQTISLSLRLDENNASMLLLVKINPRSSTTVLKPLRVTN